MSDNYYDPEEFTVLLQRKSKAKNVTLEEYSIFCNFYNVLLNIIKSYEANPQDSLYRNVINDLMKARDVLEERCLNYDIKTNQFSCKDDAIKIFAKDLQSQDILLKLINIRTPLTDSEWKCVSGDWMLPLNNNMRRHNRVKLFNLSSASISTQASNNTGRHS